MSTDNDECDLMVTWWLLWFHWIFSDYFSDFLIFSGEYDFFSLLFEVGSYLIWVRLFHLILDCDLSDKILFFKTILNSEMIFHGLNYDISYIDLFSVKLFMLIIYLSFNNGINLLLTWIDLISYSVFNFIFKKLCFILV